MSPKLSALNKLVEQLMMDGGFETEKKDGSKEKKPKAEITIMSLSKLPKKKKKLMDDDCDEDEMEGIPY